MATKNFSISIDTDFETTVGYYSGGGTSPQLFVGKSGTDGRVWRAPFKYNLDWTSVSTITSATLNFKTGDYWMGASPSYVIRRATSSWVESPAPGTAGPSDTTTGQVSGTLTGGAPGFYKWYAIDITDIVKAWAPTSIPGGGNAANYGVQLRSNTESSSSYGWAVYARESAYDSYIVLTYTTNTAPNAPTLNSPIGGAIVASQTPTLNFTPSDPEGDTHTYYTYQVDDNSDFSSPVESTEVGPGSFTNGVAVNRVVTSTLSRGTTYYWRVKTWDGALYGPYSSGQSFKIGSLPTTSVTTPASGHTAQLWYTAGTSTTPKAYAVWSYNCPDGHAQSHYRVYIYADSAGSPGSLLYDSGWLAGTDTTHSSTYAVANGTKYHVSSQVRCTLALDSAESTKNITRVRWGRASYYFDGTTTPLTLSAANSQTVGANQALVLEYATTATTAEPSTWYSTVAAAGLNRYFWHRVTMWGYGSATPTSPSLNSLTWSYSNTGLATDNWTMATGATIDTGAYVYGTQSLKHATNGAEQRSYQLVAVPPNRSIILSGRMKIAGNPAAKIRIMSSDGTVELAAASGPTVTTDWARYITPAINTGSDTELRVEAYTNAAASNTAWFDALKLEESSVATMWTPGFVSGSVTIDAGGLGVNAQKGGVLRLVGSAGTAAATVGLGVNGLQQNGVEGALVPSGVIVMWSGQTTTIPAGWFLCDGANGTPDLRDRFIIGADTTNEGTSGGTVSSSVALATHAGHSAHAGLANHEHNLPFGLDAGNNLTRWLDNGTGAETGYTKRINVSAETGTAVIAKAIAASGGTPDAHSAHDGHAIMKFYRLAYIMKA